MPRPRHAQGRPGTRVIPADWSATHRPVTAKTMTATCSIRHPGGTPGEFDPETGTTPVVPYPPHAPALSTRIQVLSLQDQEAIAGDEQVSTVAYLVTIDATAAAELALDDLVKVDTVDANGDPTLVGRELSVDSLTRGSLVWERDLICTDNLG